MRAADLFWCSLLQLLSLSMAAPAASLAARCICFVKLSSSGVHSPRVVSSQQPGGGLRCAAAEPGLLRCRWRTSPCGRVRRPPGLHCFRNGSKRRIIGGVVLEEEDPWRVLDASQRYLACVFGPCGRACAFCARVRPGSGIGVSVRAVEYSPFLVGIEWRRLISFSSLAPSLRLRSTPKYRFGLTTCWSTLHLPCKFHCAPEEPVTLVGPEGSFSVPADLYNGNVQLRVRSLGRVRHKAVFKAFFHGKQVEPSRPCDVTVRTLGWSAVQLRWKMLPHARLDGFQVSWCRIDSGLPRACSMLYLPHNVSSVVLMEIVPFLRYSYQVRAYRGDPNVSDVLFSPPSTASRTDGLSFELFLYAEKLVVFLLAAALTMAALLTIGLILTRALGLTAFFDMEPAAVVGAPGGPRENQAQGDHRRHLPAARRRWALPRVRSRGDS